MPKRKNIDFANLQKRMPLDKVSEKIMFYDVETDSKYAPYAKLNLIGVQYGFEEEPEVIKYRAGSKASAAQEIFAERYNDPTWWKVGYNNGNYDDIVLRRHGFRLDRTNWHDGYLAVKAIAPLMPSYALDFVNWWLLGDHHFEAGKVATYLKSAKTDDYSTIPNYIQLPYLRRDIEQHRNIFCITWEHLIKDKHWGAYMLDCAAIPAFTQMILDGGEYIDREYCLKEVARLQEERQEINDKAIIMTCGDVMNVNSTKQVAEYLDIEGFAIALSDSGNFSIKKRDLEDLKNKHALAQKMYRVREINGTIKFFENYLEATEIPYDSTRLFWIPKSYSLSTARTRRATSSSYYKINFQNSNEEAQKAQIVPPDEILVRFDSTQIENVVHIYESEDDARRRAYEADEDWNEYVWLCNRILGTNLGKEQLDDYKLYPSPVNGAWTIYKQFKTGKLALNFGMGSRKFCLLSNIEQSSGYRIFNEIHEACPAIRGLQNKVERLIRKHGYVQDVFGHCYTGPARKAYKIVAYFVQGCGTGSLPKAQIRANYETVQWHSRGIMCGTTHDDNSCRLRLDLGPTELIATLQELMYNMTTMFSYRFDNIPLRAKMYLSRTNAADAQEFNPYKPKTYEHLLN